MSEVLIEFIELESDKEMSVEDKNFILDMLVAWKLRSMQKDKGNE